MIGTITVLYQHMCCMSYHCFVYSNQNNFSKNNSNTTYSKDNNTCALSCIKQAYGSSSINKLMKCTWYHLVRTPNFYKQS